MKLETILSTLINSTAQKPHILSRGLLLAYTPSPYPRLVISRRNDWPSVQECATVMAALYNIIGKMPERQQYESTMRENGDSKYGCVVISWHPVQPKETKEQKHFAFIQPKGVHNYANA